MALSLQAQIVTGVITVLNTNRPAGIPEASRIRLPQIETDEQPTIAVYPGPDKERLHNRHSPVVLHELELIVECRVTGDEPDLLLDPLLNWITSVLARTHVPLGHDMQETQTNQLFEVSKAVHGLAQVRFTVNFQTRRDDRTVPA